MRAFLGLVGVVMLLGLGSWAWRSATMTAPSSTQATEAPAGTRVTLQVAGMTCGGCEIAVKMAAKRVEGVEEVTASAAEGIAQVVYDAAKTNPETIAKVITESTGFTVTVPTNEPTARKPSENAHPPHDAGSHPH